MICRCFCCISKEEQPQIGVSTNRDYPWEMYSLKELLHATNNFHQDNKIGEGEFGSVYWGRKLTGVAVKRLKTISAKTEMEFAGEVEILGRVRHKNLLGLRGFYAGGDERLIVYDYMPNHSLVTSLKIKNYKDNLYINYMYVRAYLHHESSPHIIHRDIKASNVLLDAEFEAKVADLGSLGYLAPEYAMWGKVSESCDVYSFGILLLEIISAKKPLEKLPGGVKRDILQWATPYVQKGALNHIADPRMKGKFDREQLNSAVMIALRCTDRSPEKKPSMIQVVELLKGVVGRTKQEVYYEDDIAYKDNEEKNKIDTNIYEDFGFWSGPSDDVGTTWVKPKIK
ncbi:hypothetical protein CIPAW_03G099300 [Carya illinoinensis]|uniref:Protein kinase domain-containing protein n=1 Tax=Carya illinoinensis TaxID=32201 RepID=A0A8T1R0X9_CARIL|nr:hypothetical protein CIPAW_03G099300 [Carya illinoinensis]